MLNKPQDTDAVLGDSTLPLEAGAAVLGGLRAAIDRFEGLDYLNHLHISCAAAEIARHGDDGMAYLLGQAVFFSRFYKRRAAREHLKKFSLEQLLELVNRLNDNRKMELLTLLGFIRQNYFMSGEISIKPAEIDCVAAVYKRQGSENSGRTLKVTMFDLGGNLHCDRHPNMCMGNWFSKVDGKIQMERDKVTLSTRHLTFYVEKELIYARRSPA